MSNNTKILDPDVTKMSDPNQRLLSIRKSLRLTRKYICDKYELSKETLNAWETGKLKLSEKAIQRCIDIYRSEGMVISRSWLLTGEGLNPQMSLELGKYFSSTEFLNEKQEDLDELLMVKEASFFKQTTKNTIVLLVASEEMLPFYAPGDYIGGRFCLNPKLEDYLGKDCIVITKSEQQYFRRLSKSSIDGSYNLVCLNPGWGSSLEPVIFDVDISRIAQVIWHRRPE